MNWTVRLVLLLAVVSVAALVYVLLTDPGAQRRVTATVTSLKESLVGADEPYVDPVSDGARAQANRATPSSDAPGVARAVSPDPVDDVPPGGTTGSIAGTVDPDPASGAVPTPADPEPETAEPAIGRNPVAHFLPGSLPTWADFEIQVDTPIAILAGGVVSTEVDFAGPDGLMNSNFERTVIRGSDPTTHGRVLDSAPYLALVGRVCTDTRCTDPFIVGSNTVICPADLEIGGALQLWTNNYVRVDGSQTRGTYSTTSGGFSFYIESVPPTSCGGRSAAPGVDAAVLASGRELSRPEFRVSSSQTFWKPFFLPLDQPLMLRATGEIDPNARSRSVGPDGTEVPLGTEGLVLLIPNLPYAGLVGRLCGADTCSEPFLVGRERLVCPSSSDTRHLELWINHLAPTPGLLDRAMPMTFEMFELQTRSGEFHFTVAAAPAGSCGTE